MRISNKIVLSVILAATFAIGAHAAPQTGKSHVTVAQKKAVLSTYADIALANYTDALNDAKALKKAIDRFAKNPNKKTLEATKKAWLQSRESYLTTEAFRLSQGPIDNEDGWVEKLYGAPEPELNDWPLDENMIDYTIDANDKLTHGNIIDTAGKFTPNGSNGKAVDVTKITDDKLAALNEDGGDANVAAGYHSIEFLLWGQDQDYKSMMRDSVTHGAMVAGQRPVTDFTTSKYASRRLDYLKATSDLIVDDLSKIASAWSKKEAQGCTSSANATGCYRTAFLGKTVGIAKAMKQDTALKQIFAGLGVFVKSELANERMAVAVLTPSEEDEHSCFSDNTNRDILLDYQGFKDIIKGEYTGKTPVDEHTRSIYSLLNPTTKKKIDTLFKYIDQGVNEIDRVAKTKYHFDYQIKPGNPYRQNIVDTKNSLRDLGDIMVDVASDFGIKLTTNDVTDSDETKINQ